MSIDPYEKLVTACQQEGLQQCTSSHKVADSSTVKDIAQKGQPLLSLEHAPSSASNVCSEKLTKSE
ncbi:uncharacterized protein MEPE_06462 [Melanopsichium pennsylvanicum]|uniref:Uncharacterized protein n=1 Tax=Melanopsichium pennsylvanicum TaxID=63383 RepID=A0AAJ5C894_9BASI|nr:uncharacterized protein MEPE_06462 [Melanopsichium pennsylvanicum]